MAKRDHYGHPLFPTTRLSLLPARVYPPRMRRPRCARRPGPRWLPRQRPRLGSEARRRPASCGEVPPAAAQRHLLLHSGRARPPAAGRRKESARRWPCLQRRFRRGGCDGGQRGVALACKSDGRCRPLSLTTWRASRDSTRPPCMLRARWPSDAPPRRPAGGRPPPPPSFPRCCRGLPPCAAATDTGELRLFLPRASRERQPANFVVVG